MKRIHVGIVGCGWFGNFHLEYLLKRQDVEVAALVNGGEEALRSTGAKVPGARQYRSFEDMLDKEPELDALIVCVPPHRHGNIELAGAERGIHLYVEKPLSNSLEQAESFCAAIERAGILCSVGYQERYANGIDQCRAHLSAADVGLLHGRWIGGAPGAAWWRDRVLSGGQVVEQCTHVVDLMRYFAGEAAEVFAFPGNRHRPELPGFTADSCSAACIRFESGAVATLTTGCLLTDDTLGGVDLQMYAPGVQVGFALHGGLCCRQGGKTTLYEDTADNHARAMAAFVTAVSAGDAAPIRSSYRDALETLKLTMAVERSIASGKPEKVR